MGRLVSFALLALLASGCAQQAPPSKTVVPMASGEAAETAPPVTGDGQAKSAEASRGMPTDAKVAIAVGTGVLAGVLIFGALGAVAAATALGSG